jgi:TRAP-type C4-dicarboxylate transport system permease small subunit
LDQIFDRAAWVLTRAAAVFLVAMMMITVIDVPLRAVNFPLFGTFDLVELFLVAMTYLAIPETFLREEHVVVEIIDPIVGPRVTAILRAVASGLALVLLAAMEVMMVQPALDTYAFNDVTKDLEIPKIVLWIPIHIGIACAVLAVAFVFLRDVARVFKGEAPA